MHNSDHHVITDCDPNLRSDSIGIVAVEVFDPQVLLDPAKEEFDLSAHLVESGYIDGGQFEVIGQEDIEIAGFQIVETDAAHWPGEIGAGFVSAQLAHVIAAQSSAVIDGQRTMTSKTQIVFGSGYEERPGRGHLGQAREIDIAPIDDIEGSRFETQFVEPENIGFASWSHFDAYGNRPLQIELGMEFDSRLSRTEVGPIKQIQGKIDCGRIQGVNGLGEFHTEVFSSVKSPGFGDQPLSQILPDSPIPTFVGLGQS
jgi:hypothetical protein